MPSPGAWRAINPPETLGIMISWAIIRPVRASISGSPVLPAWGTLLPGAVGKAGGCHMPGEPVGEPGAVEWLDVGSAARLLAITPTAIRKRIARGSLRAVKRDGRWAVLLPGSGEPGSPAGSPPSGEPAGVDATREPGSPERDEVIAALRAHLALAEEQIRSKDLLIAALISRGVPGSLAMIDQSESRARPAPTRWSWWRRLWGSAMLAGR